MTNVGTEALSNLVVRDDQGVTVTCPGTILAAGQSMTCTAEVALPDPIPPGLVEVVNQGTVSGANASAAVTDDPSEPGADDPAVVVLFLPPLAIPAWGPGARSCFSSSWRRPGGGPGGAARDR